MNMPVAVSPVAPELAFVSPKSDRYAYSGRPGTFSIKTLAGLTSRCTSPMACAASSAADTCSTSDATRSGASGPPPARSTVARSPPATNRVAMYSTPPTSPAA